MDPVRIRKLTPDDDRRNFSSGDPDLDRFFKRYAGQNQFRRHIGVTYIATDEASILGFVTAVPSEIAIENLSPERQRGLPHYPLPVLRIARLATAEQARGRGIGLALLRYALMLARQVAGDFGAVGVVVDARPQALGFYQRFGFEALAPVEGSLLDRPEPTPMFLPLSAIPVQAPG